MIFDILLLIVAPMVVIYFGAALIVRKYEPGNFGFKFEDGVAVKFKETTLKEILKDEGITTRKKAKNTHIQHRFIKRRTEF